MSGLSQLQRAILRLALTVNRHTQGGVAGVKTGAVVPGYRVPTVDYAGPKDLRPPLTMWAIGGLAPSRNVAGFFEHDKHSLCVKASITRATTRLLQRGLLVYAPLPRVWRPDPTLPNWGHVLTADGLAAAGTAPLDLPLLAEACELFGITHRACYETPGRYQHRRKVELVEALRNGYRRDGTDPPATEVATATAAQICRVATEAATVAEVPRWDRGNRSEATV